MLGGRGIGLKTFHALRKKYLYVSVRDRPSPQKQPIGSMIAQNVALERRDLIRKLVIVGSGPRNGHGIPLTPESQLIFTNKYGNLDDFWIDGFFTASPESQAAGRAFLKQRDARIEDRDLPISEKVQPAQFAALQEWGSPVRERFAYLKNIKIPVRIVGASPISSSTPSIPSTWSKIYLMPR